MLRFIRGDERRSVRFMSGHIVYGEPSVKDLRLGEVLLASGKLEAAVLERAAAVVVRDRKRMGAVLVEMGVLDENGLEEALALHVRSILTSVFSMREGTYTFQEQDPEAFLDDDWPLAISTGEAVLAAVRAVRSEDDVRFALGNLDRVLLGSDDPLVLYQRMDLGAEEGAVLAAGRSARPGDALGFEGMLAQGRQLLAESKAWEAAALFEAAATGGEGRMRTRARVLLGRALLQLPDREKAAEKELQAAVHDEPDHVEAHYLLGTLYRRRGLATRAASMFRRALEIDPAHRAALAEMDALEQSPPP